MEKSLPNPPAPSLRPVYPALGICAVLLGASLATFFGRMLSVAGADLRTPLGLDVDTASWISTSFGMGSMFVGPFSVYLGGLLGPRRVLMVSALVFAVLCLMLPLVGHIPVFIAVVTLAGLTSGTFYPLTLSFILRNLPRNYLPYGVAAYAVDIVVTTHLAHSWEGWLIARLSWQWIFWSFALAAPVMVVLVHFGIARQPWPHTRPDEQAPSWRGFLYASLGAALLYGALDQGMRLDWWRSATFEAMVITGLFLVLCSVLRHFSRPNPLVNYPFLRRWNTVLLGVTVLLFRFVLLATVVLVPGYLAAIDGYRPEQTGPVLLWLAIPQLAAGALAVYLLGRIDARVILATGFALVATGCMMDARIDPLWSGNSFRISQLVLALGEGLAFNGMVGSIVLEILNSGAMKNPAAVLSFGGFFQTVRLLGGELGASFIQYFLHSRQIFQYDLLASRMDRGAEAVMARVQVLGLAMQRTAPARSLAAARASILLGSSVKQQAFVLSTRDCFLMVSYASVACLVVVAGIQPLRIGFAQIVQSGESSDTPSEKPSS